MYRRQCANEAMLLSLELSRQQVRISWTLGGLLLSVTQPLVPVQVIHFLLNLTRVAVVYITWVVCKHYCENVRLWLRLWGSWLFNSTVLTLGIFKLHCHLRRQQRVGQNKKIFICNKTPSPHSWGNCFLLSNWVLADTKWQVVLFPTAGADSTTKSLAACQLLCF